MTKKVKLSDVARDLQIPTQELIGFYQERDEKGNTKKGVTGLTPEEINLALEYYSQKTQVDSLDAYFASKDKPKSKQEKKSGDKKPADKKPTSGYSRKRQRNQNVYAQMGKYQRTQKPAA